jgi:hypothetical protein
MIGGIIICRVSVCIPMIGCIAEIDICPGSAGIAPDPDVLMAIGTPCCGTIGRIPEGWPRLGMAPEACADIMPPGCGSGIAEPGSIAEISTTSWGGGGGGSGIGGEAWTIGIGRVGLCVARSTAGVICAGLYGPVNSGRLPLSGGTLKPPLASRIASPSE